MCATVHYTKLVRGRLYPKAARTGPYAFAQEVRRVKGKVVTRYIGIVRVSKDEPVIESRGLRKSDVAERGEEHDNDSREPQ